MAVTLEIYDILFQMKENRGYTYKLNLDTRHI